MTTPLTFEQATKLELPALVCDANGVIIEFNFWLINVLRIKNINNFIGKDFFHLTGIPNDILLKKSTLTPWLLHLNSPFLEKKECKIWILPLANAVLAIIQPVVIMPIGYEVELVALNNQLDKKIAQQNILIQYLEKIRFEMDQFGILQTLLEIITYDLSYQFANYFVMEKENAELHLCISNNLQRQVLDGKIIMDKNDHFWQEEHDFCFYKITAENQHLIRPYQKKFPQKIFNITQIRLKNKDNHYGTIHLINSALESHTGNEEVLSLLIEHTNKVIEKINFYKISVIDEKTGLFNIRYFQQKAHELIQEHLQQDHCCVIIMADIDHFKHFNDSHGHQAGDQVLLQVAQSLKKSCRKHDLVARFGGEEFIILLTRILPINIFSVAERIRKDIEQMVIAWPTKNLNVTISLGGAILKEHGVELNKLIEHADQALYRAKNSGRNCFFITNIKD